MKKGITVILIILTLALECASYFKQPIAFIADNDGEIEWNTYNEDEPTQL